MKLRGVLNQESHCRLELSSGNHYFLPPSDSVNGNQDVGNLAWIENFLDSSKIKTLNWDKLTFLPYLWKKQWPSFLVPNSCFDELIESDAKSRSCPIKHFFFLEALPARGPHHQGALVITTIKMTIVILTFLFFNLFLPQAPQLIEFYSIVIFEKVWTGWKVQQQELNL